MKKLIGSMATLFALTAGCGADNQLGRHSLVQDDGGASVCFGVPAESLCPATWELAQDKTQYQCGTRARVELGDDGTHLARKDSSDGQEAFCVYDRTSHALVGTRLSVFFAAPFCDGTSNEIVSGPETVEVWRNFLANLGEGPRCADSGHCKVDLATSTCPKTWEQAEIARCEPAWVLFPTVLGHAAGYLAFGTTTPQYIPFACYYDAATHALAAAWAANDTPSFCGGTSFDGLYGAIDERLTIREDIAVVPCTSDGGTADAPPDL